MVPLLFPQVAEGDRAAATKPVSILLRKGVRQTAKWDIQSPQSGASEPSDGHYVHVSKFDTWFSKWYDY